MRCYICGNELTTGDNGKACQKCQLKLFGFTPNGIELNKRISDLQAVISSQATSLRELEAHCAVLERIDNTAELAYKNRITELVTENEKLEAEIEELKNRPSDIEHLNKMSEQYSAEFHKALKQERKKRQLIKLELIKELREFAEKNSHQSYAGQPQFKAVDLTQLLAKLDLLEGEK